MNKTSRSIYNPVQKDTVVFLETLAETAGNYTAVEVDLAPGGGNGLHYHKTYAERFECLEGEWSIQLRKKVFTLKTGEIATAEKVVLHRFFNASAKQCRFKVTISPGCRGFEETLQIAYGLARDGRTNKQGLPSRLSHMALLLTLSESNLPGWQSVLEKGLRLVSKRAVKNGIADQLRKEYVKI